MIGALVVVAGALALVAYVIAPLRRNTNTRVPDVNNARAEAEADKRVALSSLVELDQERDAGKLTDDDYESLKADYEYEAVAALRRVDALDDGTQKPIEPDDDLEAEIALIKSQLPCPECGEPRGGGARCQRCGA